MSWIRPTPWGARPTRSSLARAATGASRAARLATPLSLALPAAALLLGACGRSPKDPARRPPLPEALWRALPVAEGEPGAPEPHLVVTTREIRFRDRPVMALEGGRLVGPAGADRARAHFVRPLFEVLRAHYKTLPRGPAALTVVSAGDVPYETLSKVLYTANQAAFYCFRMLVRPPGVAALASLPVGVPKLGPPPDPTRLEAHEDGCGQRYWRYPTAPAAGAAPGSTPAGFTGWGSFETKVKPRPGAAVWMSRATVQGRFDAAAVRRVVRAHFGAFKACYVGKGLAERPTLKGKVELAFTVSRGGRVGQVTLASSTLNHSATEECLRGVVKDWRLPDPPEGTVLVKVPVHFSPGLAPAPGR